MNNRVVVTGMGAVTPIGNDLESFWSAIKLGKNGIDKITLFDASDYKVTIAAEIKDFDPELYIDKKDVRKMDRFCQLGMAAAVQAFNDSGIKEGDYDPNDFATICGTGIGGMQTTQNEQIKLLNQGTTRVSPFMVPMIIGNILGGNIAIKYNARNSSYCVVTACSSGTDAIGEAYQLIKHGRAKLAMTGGAEACISPLPFSGFINMRAMSTKNDINNSSTPFDVNRDGFIMGEGAGMLLIEEYEHALARGAKIYAEIVGYGSTCDAYHITSPSADGDGAIRSMKQAISEAGIPPSSISYINAHGTSTPPNDETETKAIKACFGESAYNIPVSSTKSMTGHMLGATGAVESIVCIKAMQENYIPPTINLNNIDPELDLDYVPNVGRNAELEYTLTNTFGFGGHNATLVFKKI